MIRGHCWAHFAENHTSGKNQIPWEGSHESPFILRIIVDDDIHIFKIILQNYDTTESKLRRELESYGPIRQVSYHCFLIYYCFVVIP